MGQYYAPTLINKEGKITTFDPSEYGNGLKLTEHSYFGEEICKVIEKELYNNPCRLYWMGDYAEVKDFDEKQVKTVKELYNINLDNDFLKNIIHDVYKCSDIVPTDEDSPRYIINHTKEIYLDLNLYDEDTIIHPLPLLTAVGNGRGGGDYFDSYNDYMVGTWAGDVIETTDKKPEDYYVRTYVEFKERD